MFSADQKQTLHASLENYKVCRVSCPGAFSTSVCAFAGSSVDQREFLAFLLKGSAVGRSLGPGTHGCPLGGSCPTCCVLRRRCPLPSTLVTSCFLLASQARHEDAILKARTAISMLSEEVGPAPVPHTAPKEPEQLLVYAWQGLGLAQAQCPQRAERMEAQSSLATAVELAHQRLGWGHPVTTRVTQSYEGLLLQGGRGVPVT